MDASHVVGQPAAVRPVTMRQVAELAGVNISTVSRALGQAEGSRRGVSAEVVLAIRELADELGYSPNPNAASIRTRRTRAIGVLVPRLSDVVLARIFEGIDDFVTEHGYQAVVASTDDNPAERRRRLDLLLSRRIDGCIIGDAHASGAEMAEVDKAAIPVVLVNRKAPGYTSVTCADHAGGRLIGEHFLKLGHRQVGIAGGHPWASTAIERTDGCRSYLAEHGVIVPDDYVIHSGFDVRGGRRAAEALLDLSPRPTAIFALNDYAAIGVMGELRDRGLTPGMDVAVAGFNDIDLARELLIPLTSVDSSPHHMGGVAAEVLLARLAGRPVESTQLAPVLRPRSTTLGRLLPRKSELDPETLH